MGKAKEGESEKGTNCLFREIITENCSNLSSEADRTLKFPNAAKTNTKRHTRARVVA